MMGEQIEMLQEAIVVYEELISRLKPRQIRKMIKDDIWIAHYLMVDTI
jgi:rubrerythrin